MCRTMIGGINYSIAEKQSNLVYKRAKAFAQNSITWRIQDAKRAGVNPLAALGYSGSGYQEWAIIWVLKISVIVLAVLGRLLVNLLDVL